MKLFYLVNRNFVNQNYDRIMGAFESLEKIQEVLSNFHAEVKVLIKRTVQYSLNVETYKEEPFSSKLEVFLESNTGFQMKEYEIWMGTLNQQGLHSIEILDKDSVWK